MINANRTLTVLLLSLAFCLSGINCASVQKSYYPGGELKTQVNYKKGKMEGMEFCYHDRWEDASG